jgi:hypothetical protein
MVKGVSNLKEEKYYCFSCDGPIEKELIEKAKKTGKKAGLCQWCKDLARSLRKK